MERELEGLRRADGHTGRGFNEIEDTLNNPVRRARARARARARVSYAPASDLSSSSSSSLSCAPSPSSEEHDWSSPAQTPLPMDIPQTTVDSTCETASSSEPDSSSRVALSSELGSSSEVASPPELGSSFRDASPSPSSDRPSHTRSTVSTATPTPLEPIHSWGVFMPLLADLHLLNINANTRNPDMNAAADAVVDATVENKLINEEYKIWKKNAVFLYDIIYSRALEWPTLTTQWLPDVQRIPDKPFSSHRLLIGTHTSTDAQNYLQIAQINLPNRPAANPSEYDAEREELGGFGAAKEPITFSIVQKINHPGEVNKARYMPQNPDIIATMTVHGDALVFDRTKHTMQPKNNTIDAQIELKGHESEGFGLDWNPHTEGQIATGSEDRTVRVWDIKDYQTSNKTLGASRVFTHHSATVNDVQWHPKHGKNLLGTVSDDNTFCLLDLRQNSNSKPTMRIKAGDDAINCLAFHAKHDVLFATGSADKSVSIFDMRFPEHGKIHSMDLHTDVVTKVEWHPHDSSILASSGDDRRVIFWDISRTGQEQTPEDAEDGPPETLFMHGGHTSRVSDFSWNKNDPWVMCSVAEDNLLQVWRASRHLVETLPPGIQRREVSPTQ